jgi:hypothetical protein
MSVPVPLDELSAALGRRSNAAYLLTVSDDASAHCVASTVGWTGDELVVPAGATSLRNATARGHVVLLAPPAGGLAALPPEPDGEGGGEEEGYSLIIDAEVTATFSGGGAATGALRARPTHAVLHRPAVAADGSPAHDCVHVFGKP